MSEQRRSHGESPSGGNSSPPEGAGTVGTEHPDAPVVGGRRDVSADQEPRRRPHVSENARDAPVQQTGGHSQTEKPVLPPNASGSDQISPGEEPLQEIREDSMYEGRPEEDKDRPASG